MLQNEFENYALFFSYQLDKIQQKFILHLQIWIGSVQPSFLELEADTIGEGQLKFARLKLEHFKISTTGFEPTRVKLNKFQVCFLSHSNISTLLENFIVFSIFILQW